MNDPESIAARIRTGRPPATEKIVIDGLIYIRDSDNKYVVDTSIKSMPINCPSDAWPWLHHMSGYEQEVLTVLVLDGRNAVISVHEITKGLVNRSVVHPREVFKEAIRRNGTSLMLAHNHPSGNTTPSESDKVTTQTLCSAGRLLSIPVIDHLIVTKSGSASMRELNPGLFL